MNKKVVTLIALTVVACMALPAFAASGTVIERNTPSYVNSAKYLGAADPTKTIEVSIWLQPHNRAGLDQLAHDLYDKNSPVYHQWLKRGDIALHFAPTDAEAKTVQDFFESHNLKVVSVGPHNFYVRASGTVGDVQSAFHVQLNNYEVRGETIRSNDRDPSVDGDAARLVQAVAGLDSGHYNHPLAQRAAKLPKGQTLAAEKVTPSANTFFTPDCFPGTTTQRYTSDGTYPIGTFTGNAYGTPSKDPGCGYSPANIQAAYGLTSVYNSGYNGAGQTIVIVDWCGSPSIRSDANVFSAKFGLPLLTSSNFSIIETPSKSYCSAPDPEINLDVEWSHAIAPGANIDLVVPPSATFQDTDQAVFYAVDYDLGNVISNSYGAVEAFVAPTALETQNLISELAAVNGISANFATGDEGDDTVYGIPPSVNAPADSPYSTAVGGISLALTSSNSIAWQSAWGTDETLLDDEGFIFDPPIAFGFNFGGGGGASGFYSAPSYQASLDNPWRQLPDVSWLADPFTGGIIALSEPGETVSFYVYGGTSLATPMFSGLWAIANQAAGAPLGQAAPYMYNLPSGAIYDILPVNSSTNVTATIQDSKTVTNTYDADQVMNLSGPFYSGIWDYFYVPGLVYSISFGTDSSLTAGPGWDNATGVGTPNPPAFISYFTAAPAKK